MRGLSTSTEELVKYARKILGELQPMTLRQLHYVIFSRGGIEYDNCPRDYHRLSNHTTNARRKYRAWELAGCEGSRPDYGIPPGWIVDAHREVHRVSMWEDSGEYADTIRTAYRRDLWQDQPYRVEVWSEKATILSSIRPVTDRYGVPVRVMHGFGSTGMETVVAEDFEDEDRHIAVFFLGDHDPSGHCIEEDIHRRVETASGIEFELTRVAINADDIDIFHLPPQRIKDTDSRAKAFRKRFGADAATVELDALPPEELRTRLRIVIEYMINSPLWEHQKAIQEVELASIQQFADTLKSLPKGPMA